MSFKYGAEAMALLGVAYALIKWVGRTLRSLISDAPLEASRLEGLTAMPADAAADALVRRGIVSPEQLAAMTPREREFLVASATSKREATTDREAATRPVVSRRPTPSTSMAPMAPMAPTLSGRAATPLPTPTRLHLITPSRPPLGVAVHCPGCGVPLDRDALQRFGATTCSRCKRPVSAHIQRGRLTVIVEETVEEGEHRRRMDGER